MNNKEFKETIERLAQNHTVDSMPYNWRERDVEELSDDFYVWMARKLWNQFIEERYT